MNRENTIKLLNETFKTNFDLKRYVKFVKELLNEFKVKERDCTNYIANEYKNYIEEFIQIGNYKDKNSKEMEVLVVKLKRTSSKNRARTMQRNFVANWLGKMRKEAALVAFYDDTVDWRFSFVKMEYNLVKGESGKVKVKKELTPAKRYSFLVGPNEPNHTCRKQFLELIMEDEMNPLSDEIEESFSIEKVTEDFFKKYKELYLDLKEELEKLLNKNKYVKGEFEKKNISTIDFAKKLLGQIVFLYFLQKKGWLGVKKSPGEGFYKWGTGPKDFMRKLFEKGIVHYDNFFNEILEPLFYEALAEDRRANHDYYSRFNCKIPFLNGGLFEPINDYDWAGTEITLDNSIFKEIFDTFDRFNFTVKEDEPLEKEVAVDPEMLGKVFEKLLDVKERKSKGAYYTPREIVHYMCQQSLINYLETNISIPHKDIKKFVQMGDVVLDRTIRAQEQRRRYGELRDVDEESIIPNSIEKNQERINSLLGKIKIVDPACGSGAFLIGMLKEIKKAQSILSIYSGKEENVYDMKKKIIEDSLYGVDIEPSAVQICKLRMWLSLIVDETDITNINPLPNLDHKIMCGNSLLEEFEGIKLFDERLLGEVEEKVSPKIKEIDNEINELYEEKGIIARKGSDEKNLKDIDRKIRRLRKKKEKIISKFNNNERNLTLNEAVQRRIRESQIKLKDLKKLQKKFFNEQNRKLKREHKEKINRLEWELIEETLKEQGNEKSMKKLKQYKKNKAKPFFLWKLYFAEVFQRENPGFDVVIGNPPYVRIQSIDKEIKSAYKSNFISAKGKFDLYVLFTELGIKILRKRGSISYIMPNKFTNTHYGRKIREFILKHTSINIYIDFSDKGVFEGATNYPCIILLRKEKLEDNIIYYANVKQISSSLLHSLNLSKGLPKFENEDISSFKYNQSNLDKNNWVFVNKKILKLLKKLKSSKYDNLATHSEKIYEGLITGNNKAYFVNKETIKKHNLEPELIKKLPKGRKIKKYFIGWDNRYVIYPYELRDGKTSLVNLNNFPNTKTYLETHKSQLKKRTYVIKAGKEWYEIWNPRTIEVFATKKIITPNLSKRNRFALDDFSDKNNFMCIDHDCYAIILRQKDLENYKIFTALLNSPLIDFFIRNISPMFSGGFYKYHTQYLDKIPIPKDLRNTSDIIKLVDKILLITKDSEYLDNPEKQAKVKKLEKEIDQLVYKLYGLNPEKIKIIEEFNSNK